MLDVTANAKFVEIMRAAGLRPTRQRLALARLLFFGENQHFTAENLYDRAQAADTKVSLATVYNTLHQFTESGLLRQVTMDSQRNYFDTNVADHHHFYFEDTGEIADIPKDQMNDLTALMDPVELPDQMILSRVEIVVRLRTAQ